MYEFDNSMMISRFDISQTNRPSGLKLRHLFFSKYPTSARGPGGRGEVGIVGQFSLFLCNLIWNRQLMGTVLLNELVALIWPVVACFKCCTSYSG